MPILELTIDKLDVLARTLQTLADPTVPMAQGLTEHAEMVMTDAKANYVPVDIGTLRNSGTVLTPTVHGDTVEVRLGFGGAAEDYALEQHERLDFHHTVGQAKYLERPVLAHANALPETVAQAVTRWIVQAAR